MRLAVLTRYDSLGASSRVRALQFLDGWREQGIQAEVFPLLSNRYVQSLYEGRRAWAEVAGAYLRRWRDCTRLGAFDLVWLEKELLPVLPFALESGLLTSRRYVLDLDDAVFHNYDRSRHAWVRGLLGSKLDRLMHGAALVTAGNSYLAARAQAAGAPWVEQVPSTVPLQRYGCPSYRPRTAGETLRIVWIGSPATAHYLELVRGALQRAAAEMDLALLVIGATAPDWPGVKTESIPWTETGELAALSRGHLGVMPLADSPWERGKCSFKLIQYMACAIPVLASPVGMNIDVVEPGRNGWLAATEEDWLQAIRSAHADPQHAAALGAQGRDDVERLYSSEAIGVRLAGLFRRAARPEPIS
jgi:glycosyltransferase involved in cell wall biosynthesis